jgi:hypothetical protein
MARAALLGTAGRRSDDEEHEARGTAARAAVIMKAMLRTFMI